MTFYFLCEGDFNKSEYLFVDAVLKLYNRGENYKLLAAGGNNNILGVFNSLINYMGSGDVFTLFFDSVETIGHVFVSDILKQIELACIEKGVEFRYTNYYCFEEIFLSYEGILDIINVDEDTKNKVIELQKDIKNGVNYFRKDLSFWRSLYSNEIGIFRTRETLSSGICANLLNRVVDFRVLKSKLGVCWYTDCKYSSIHTKFCDKCQYRMRNTPFSHKLEDLSENSILRGDIKLKDIFKKEE